jgi:hypothetical protein
MLEQTPRTVYALYYPESQRVFETMFSNPADLHSLYTQAYTKKQDAMHKTFFDTYAQWASPHVTINQAKFSHQYPTAGSSEAIREQLAHIKASGIELLYVLDEEYEGYEKIAEAVNIDVIKISRSEIFNYDFGTLSAVFFISQPSAIDGNVWQDFDKFMRHLQDQAPQVSIYADLCYLGCTKKMKHLNTDNYPNLSGIFFSLSKSFGVYYHRIGGVYLREANPLLWGNGWFKNLLSMEFGTALMKTHDVFHFPNTYQTKQQVIIENLNRSYLGNNVVAADVILLANINDSALTENEKSKLKRGYHSTQTRLCLTPIIDNDINDAVNGQSSALHLITGG